MLDPKIRDMAQGKNFATLSVHAPDGAIATHVMWVDADDDHILINTEVHRFKYKAMVTNPQVTVTIIDATNPYSYAEVRGTVVGEITGQAARDHIDFCSRKYTGGDYANPIQSERIVVKIAPNRQHTH